MSERKKIMKNINETTFKELFIAQFAKKELSIKRDQYIDNFCIMPQIMRFVKMSHIEIPSYILSDVIMRVAKKMSHIENPPYILSDVVPYIMPNSTHLDQDNNRCFRFKLKELQKELSENSLLKELGINFSSDEIVNGFKEFAGDMGLLYFIRQDENTGDEVIDVAFGRIDVPVLGEAIRKFQKSELD